MLGLLAALLDPGDEAPLIGMVIIAASVLAILILRPLVMALSKRVQGKVEDPGLADRVRELEGRVHELEDAAHRTAELEERLDFAERLLTQQREANKLPR